jgi:hypothetical protein
VFPCERHSPPTTPLTPPPGCSFLVALGLAVCPLAGRGACLPRLVVVVTTSPRRSANAPTQCWRRFFSSWPALWTRERGMRPKMNGLFLGMLGHGAADGRVQGRARQSSVFFCGRHRHGRSNTVAGAKSCSPAQRKHIFGEDPSSYYSRYTCAGSTNKQSSHDS